MDDERLERMLDEGLAGYGAEDPLAGMEERILARIGAAERARHRLTGWGALTLAAAALAAIAVVQQPPSQRHKERVPPVRRMAEAPEIHPPVSSMQAVQLHRPKRVSSWPKLPVFPAPTPLTAEERLLIAMVKEDPKRAAEAFESLRKRSEPIEIAPLVIAPLESTTEK